jgi:hypothetical protein
MTQDEYVDLLVECSRVKNDLEDAIVASTSLEELRPIYERYKALLVRKRQAVVDGRFSDEP